MTGQVRSKTVSDSFEDACVTSGTHDAANALTGKAKFGPRHVPLGPRLPGWKRHSDVLTDLAERAERTFARQQFVLALKRGDVVRPAHCERCGRPPRFKTRISAHHTDYRKPLQVSWLCLWCHTWADQQTKMVYLTLYGMPLIGNIDWRWKAGIK